VITEKKIRQVYTPSMMSAYQLSKCVFVPNASHFHKRVITLVKLGSGSVHVRSSISRSAKERFGKTSRIEATGMPSRLGIELALFSTRDVELHYKRG
jgi:hypothetical protein